jgi:CPA2 family monovalent cation:H+ antiporter-2
VIGMATGLGLINAGVSSLTLAVTSLSMALVPALSLLARRLARKLARKLEPPKRPDPALAMVQRGGKSHAIVVGHRRVGEVVCAMLERHRFPFIAIDSDPVAVAEHRRHGREVYYGDAANPAFLKSCGLMEAAAVIVTIRSQAAIDEIVKLVRALRPDIPVVSRARDAALARHLYAIGVTDAVPETIDLQLTKAALVGLRLPAGPVIASIHEKRDEFRHELQEAAAQAGVQTTSSIRRRRRK